MSNDGIGSLSLDLKKLKLPAWLTLGSPAEGGSAGLKAKYPPVAMDMGANRLTLVRLGKDRAKKWKLTSFDLVEVPPDLIDSEFFRVKIKSADRFAALVAGALQKEGVKTSSISMVLPDHLARVALLPFEELPRTRREVMDMVRWKMKKAVPFKVEDAVVDYQVMPGPDGKGYMLIAVLIPNGIVEEHEAIFQKQGIHPGLIDLSSFSLAHLYQPIIEKEVPVGGDFMLLNVATAFFTLMIFREGRLMFYRCKTFSFGGEDSPESRARLVRREIQTSLLYYQERLSGRGLSRVYMRVEGHDPEQVASMFEGAPVAAPPEMIDPGRVVDLSGRIAAVGPERAAEVLQRIAPAVGAALGRGAS